MECIVKDSFKYSTTPNSQNISWSEHQSRKMFCRDEDGKEIREGDEAFFYVEGSPFERNGTIKYKNDRFEIHCFDQFLQKWVKYTWSDSLECYRKEG